MDALRDYWAIIAAAIAVVVWLVRLESRVIRDSKNETQSPFPTSEAFSIGVNSAVGDQVNARTCRVEATAGGGYSNGGPTGTGLALDLNAHASGTPVSCLHGQPPHQAAFFKTAK